MYNLRKKRRRDISPNSASVKKPRPIFTRWQYQARETAPAREIAPAPEERGSTPAEKFGQYFEAAKSVPPRSISPPRLAGTEVKNIKDLKSSKDYLKLAVKNFTGLYFILRRHQTTQSHALRIQETDFELQCIVHKGVSDATLSSFMGSLWDIFEMLFNHFMESGQFHEIVFHATHNQLEGSLSTSIFNLVPENREKIVYEMLSKLAAWNESSKVGAAMREVGISVTLLRRNLPGNGVPLLAVGDNNLRAKAFSRLNYTGSILYVDCESNCFFVAIYLCLMYHRSVEIFKVAKSKRKKLEIHRLMYQTVELKGEEIERYKIYTRF